MNHSKIDECEKPVKVVAYEAGLDEDGMIVLRARVARLKTNLEDTFIVEFNMTSFIAFSIASSLAEVLDISLSPEAAPKH